MDEKGFQELRERLQKANGLRSRISKCKLSVAEYSHILDAAQPFSNRQEFAKKKLEYWMSELDKAKKKYANF